MMGQDKANRLIDFVNALTDYYGARSIIHPNGHRQFSNPWREAGNGPSYIFIRKSDGQVRCGESITQSWNMGDRMLDQIASRQKTLPAAMRVAEPA